MSLYLGPLVHVACVLLGSHSQGKEKCPARFQGPPAGLVGETGLKYSDVEVECAF